ncbi:rad51 domain-containing protein [Hirsutella rhossiliensis]|uniref:Rad51 domain-containing protein n=1 Tax=Hirsutella rhossiliensis TaxID=111463 RepID=A0A9P8N2A7_9HYPO|nr:rad51 domain-containing protein [Hirsutella rhossiliensis]KAH0966953.1 rad51 domain-containing protein [Hirsutella rhossiliensis]
MTDLVRILPSFPVAPFAALLATIEQHALTTTDLLALHPADIAKQTHLSLLDLKRLIAAVQASLSDDLVPEKLLLEASPPPNPASSAADTTPEDTRPPRPTATTRDVSAVAFISTLDHGLDAALGGGVPVGCITEFAGESGAGKTQLLLSLCLAVQLPPPRGPRKQAVYISTESGLATQRLKQMMASNPVLAAVDDPPSLDNIFITLTPDLESQEHILEYQVPVLLSRHRIGLLVIDSVAANYRAEFERRGSHGSNMAARSAELVRLGSLLRDLARRHGIAVVVANQVADRFSLPPAIRSIPPRGIPAGTQETPLASRSAGPATSLASTPSSPSPFPPFPEDVPPAPPALRLDHQQRWFTGWGDDPHASDPPKTPSLGLVWSTQIACRVALLKRPVYGRPRRIAAPLDADDDDVDAAAPTLKSWRRWMKVVFAPHVGASGQGVDGSTEFEVTTGGLTAVKAKTAKSS